MDNYDMSIIGMTMHKVRLTFQQWRCIAEVTVEVGGNCSGMQLVSSAVDQAYQSLYAGRGLEDEVGIILYAIDHDGTLTVMDEDDEGESWLGRMLVKFEVIDVKAWNGKAIRDDPVWDGMCEILKGAVRHDKSLPKNVKTAGSKSGTQRKKGAPSEAYFGPDPMSAQDWRKSPAIPPEKKRKPSEVHTSDPHGSAARKKPVPCYFAIRAPGLVDTVRIERAVSHAEAYRMAFGRTLSQYEWKNLGTRVKILHSDKKRVALLKEPKGWLKEKGR